MVDDRHCLPLGDGMPSALSDAATPRIAPAGEILLEDPTNDGGFLGDDDSPVVVQAVAIGCGPVSAPSLSRLGDLPSQDVSTEVAQVGVLGLLLDEVQQSAGKVVPVDSPLGDRLQPNAGISERKDPVAAFDGIKSAKTVLVPTQNNLELTLLGIFPHSEEACPAFRVITTDARVGVLS